MAHASQEVLFICRLKTFEFMATEREGVGAISGESELEFLISDIALVTPLVTARCIFVVCYYPY